MSILRSCICLLLLITNKEFDQKIQIYLFHVINSEQKKDYVIIFEGQKIKQCLLAVNNTYIFLSPTLRCLLFIRYW